MDYETSAQQADKANVRFPDGMRDMIKREAKRNQRTMNAEIVYRLNQAYSGLETQKGSVTA